MTRDALLQYLKRFSPEIILFLAYFVAGRIGLSIRAVDTFAPLVWPATGLAFAALVLYGYRLWPAVALAAFALYISLGAEFLVALGVAFGNTLESLAGAYFLKRYIGFDPAVARLRDNIGLIAVALCTPLIGASIGVASLWSGGALAAADVATAWSSWWIGNAFGILIIGALLFKWLSAPLFRRTTLQYLELFTVIAVTFFTSIFIFWMPQGQFDFDYFIFINQRLINNGQIKILRESPIPVIVLWHGHDGASAVPN